ncbi:MAG: TIM barrel protein [Mariniblastus sp.]|nr:TIM barrel protein [Mariniblastus sp.]
MYKVLNSSGLGVGGKQNELIELALTHGFNGVEVDMADLVGRHDTLGKQFACQFLQSAKIDMGTFMLPVDIGGTDEQFTESIAKLDTILDLAQTLNARCCYVQIAPNNEHYSFQECFEKHQTRIEQIAEKFEASSIKIGLALNASDTKPADGNFKFIQTASELLPLVKAIGKPNVGICLDAWEWAIGGGTVEQLTNAGIAAVVTEVKLADVSADADVAAIKKSDRTTLPGEAEGSFSVELCKAILESGADLPFSVSTDLSSFANSPRGTVVSNLSKQLDLLMTGQDPAALTKAAAEAAENEEASEEGEASEKASDPVATATTE